MILRQLRDRKRASRINTAASFRGKATCRRCARSAKCSSCGRTSSGAGSGFISQSALKVSKAYAQWDAEVQFEVPGVRVTDPKAAQCGEVLKGVLKPPQCKLFGKECNPEHPIGALMVSSEGACAAYYRYVHLNESVDALYAMETDRARHAARAFRRRANRDGARRRR